MPHTASRRFLISAVRSSSRRRLARSSTRRVLWYIALTESSTSSTTGQPRNRRCIRVSSRERRSRAGYKIEHQNAHRRRSSRGASVYIHVYTSEANSTNPGCMEEACEYGLTRGTCFVARRLQVVAVAGLLWIYSVVCFFSV